MAATITPGTIVKKTCDTKLIAANKDEKYCYSLDNQNKDETKRKTDSAAELNQRTDNMLLRSTTATIVDSLLRLGGSDDTSCKSSSDLSKMKRKRTVSLVEDHDASSTDTESIDKETDVSSADTAKRQKMAPSQVLSSIPTKISLSTSNMSSLAKESNIESSAQLRALCNSANRKTPGSIGCISQFFHEDFRPLQAAPRLPKGIVAEPSPPIHSVPFSYVPTPAPQPQGPLYSTEITEHNDWLIMHQFTVVPKANPYRMSHIQLPSGY